MRGKLKCGAARRSGTNTAKPGNRERNWPAAAVLSRPRGSWAMTRPFSPETLADRWNCSPQKVRLMFHAGELQGFRLGKLIRIPAAEVERIECQTSTVSE